MRGIGRTASFWAIYKKSEIINYLGNTLNMSKYFILIIQKYNVCLFFFLNFSGITNYLAIVKMRSGKIANREEREVQECCRWMRTRFFEMFQRNKCCEKFEFIDCFFLNKIIINFIRFGLFMEPLQDEIKSL